MKVKGKTSEIIWYAHQFNIHGIGEMIIQNEEYGADSVYIKDFDVWLESKQEWKDMAQAFRDKDLIIDNYNTIFFELKTQEDKIRGFTL